MITEQPINCPRWKKHFLIRVWGDRHETNDESLYTVQRALFGMLIDVE